MFTYWFTFVICLACVSKIIAEEYNLYGDAGQAYALEVNIGHPHQKVGKQFFILIKIFLTMIWFSSSVSYIIYV